MSAKSETQTELIPMDVGHVLADERLDGEGSLPQQVYRLVRKLIVSLDFLPNQILSEKDVAKSLNISKTPVREAFIRLSEDGMLRVVPQSGTYVAPIDLNRAEEGYFVWSALESGCAARVAEKCSVEDVHYLRELLDRQKKALDHDDFLAFYADDGRFHDVMFEIAGFPNAKRLIETAKFEVDRIRNLKKRYRLRPVDEVHAEHVAIVNAIAGGDAETARKAMHRHLSRVNEALLALVKTEDLWGVFRILNSNHPGRRRARRGGKGKASGT